jgi:hypothetical protein
MAIDKTLGYAYFLDRTHPLANSQGKVYVHRVVASEKIGRWIKTEEHVHHIDGDTNNNHPDNLEIMSRSEHAILESRKRYGEKIAIECPVCGQEHFNDTYCSIECARFKRRVVINRPSSEELTKLVNEIGFCAVGRMYGVSDNAIRKWMK